MQGWVQDFQQKCDFWFDIKKIKPSKCYSDHQFTDISKQIKKISLQIVFLQVNTQEINIRNRLDHSEKSPNSPLPPLVTRLAYWPKSEISLVSKFSCQPSGVPLPYPNHSYLSRDRKPVTSLGNLFHVMYLTYLFHTLKHVR